MDKTNDSAVLSLRLQGAVLAELTERAQYAGKTRSRFARELIMKSLAGSRPGENDLSDGGRGGTDEAARAQAAAQR